MSKKSCRDYKTSTAYAKSRPIVTIHLETWWWWKHSGEWHMHEHVKDHSNSSADSPIKSLSLKTSFSTA